MTAVPPRPAAGEPVKGRYELTPLGRVLVGAAPEVSACPVSVHWLDATPSTPCVLRRGHDGGHIYDAGMFS